MFLASNKWKFMVLIFLLSFFLLNIPFQTGNLNAINSKTNVKAEIYALLEKKDFVPVIVTLKEKAALEKALHQQKGKNPAQVVVNTLRDTSRCSEEKIRSLLTEEIEEGSIKDFRPFWIINAFAASINARGLEKLLTLPDIEQIAIERITQAPTPSAQPLPWKGNFGVTYSPPSPVEGNQKGYSWNLALINAPQVWQLGIYGKDIVVAILDTGVDLNHPALKENYRGYQEGHNHQTSWYDAVKNTSHDGPGDSNGHGTHIAGIIAGGTPENPLGIAPGAKWIATNIFANGYAWDSHITEAFQWLLAPGGDPENAPAIINCSWASKPEYVSDYLHWEILHNLEQAGISVFFAAGNNAQHGPGSPASYPHAFSVGAVQKKGETTTIADFSSRGPVNWQGTSYIKPEIVAPGCNITSTWLNNNYITLEGTSTATAHVSGAAALLLESNRALTPLQIKYLLTSTAFWDPAWDRYGKRPNNIYGHGLLDVQAAILQSLSFPEETIIFEDSAEQGILNWNTSPAYPWKITREIVHAGKFAFADSPWGNYQNRSQSWLSLANPINLSGYHSPVLSFWHFYALQGGEKEDDYGYLEISVDGCNWIRLYRFSGTNEKMEHCELPLDLPPQTKSFYFRFRLESNNNGPGPGWYIDDLSVAATLLPLTALEQLRLVPERQEIGIEECLKIRAEAVFSPHFAREIAINLLQLGSSDPAVAKIEKGVLQGVSAGEAIISARFAGKTAYFTVKVLDLKKPVVNRPPGTYVNSVEIELKPSLLGAEIYYTLDGSNPDKNSVLYQGPLTISETTVLKARAYYHSIAGPLETFSYTIKQGAAVRGSIKVQGRPRDNLYTEAFFICKEEGTKYAIPFISEEGLFSIELPFGRYKLAVKKQDSLRKVIDVQVKDEEKQMQELKPLTLPAGDLNDDNKIDLTDLTLLSLAYGSQPGDTHWNPLADIDANGVVDFKDLIILTKNYGLSGDSF